MNETLLRRSALAAVVGTGFSSTLLLYPLTQLPSFTPASLFHGGSNTIWQFLLYLPLPVFFFVLFRAEEALPISRALKYAALAEAILTTVQLVGPAYSWVHRLVARWDILGVLDSRALWEETIAPAITLLGGVTIVLFAVVLFLTASVGISRTGGAQAAGRVNTRDSKLVASGPLPAPNPANRRWTILRKAALAAAIAIGLRTAIPVYLTFSPWNDPGYVAYREAHASAFLRSILSLVVAVFASGALIAVLALIAKGPTAKTTAAPLPATTDPLRSKKRKSRGRI